MLPSEGMIIFARGLRVSSPVFINLLHNIASMNLSTIKESFECWYNQFISKGNHVSVVLNYSDTQTRILKAYHTVKMELCTVHIKDNHSIVTPLLRLQENYNHGITTEQEAKEMMTKKLLMALYSYKQ